MSIAMVFLILAGLSSAQDPQKGFEPAPFHPGVDQGKVNEAIRKGIAYLRSAGSAGSDEVGPNGNELILWTFIHADVPGSDAQFQRLLKAILEEPLERTYKVALQAMCLAEIDRVKHQGRIAQCAQFLVDNQCKNGQWPYGTPTDFVKEIPSPGEVRKDVSTSGNAGPSSPPEARQKPRVANTITIKKKKEGPESGDNSNAQYAALGLRACHDAGVKVQEGVLLLAMNWWRQSQQRGKDNGYGGMGGWTYKTDAGKPVLCSMTAGAVGSLILYDYMLGREWKKDAAVMAGMAWLTVNFTVTENKGRPTPGDWHHYYLYAMERMAILYGTEKLGRHEWYPEGAKVLLESQRENGSWDGAHSYAPLAHDEWSTCFAILFLKRATRPLVASVDAGRK
jgi:hypothetical protein